MSAAGLVVVTTIHTEDGQDGRLLDWKRQEGEILGRTEGFIERLVARSATDPQRFVNVSRWSSLDGLARLQADPAYGELSASFGLTMFPPEVRDAPRPVVQTGGSTVAGLGSSAAPFQVVSRLRAELLVAERAESGELPEPGALLFSYDADTGPEGEEAFVAFKRVEADGQLSAPGFHLRYLAAVSGEESTFFYASVWDGRPSADRFHEAFVASDAYQQHYGRIPPFRRAPSFCDSVVELVTFAHSRAGG